MSSINRDDLSLFKHIQTLFVYFARRLITDARMLWNVWISCGAVLPFISHLMASVRARFNGMVVPFVRRESQIVHRKFVSFVRWSSRPEYSIGVQLSEIDSKRFYYYLSQKRQITCHQIHNNCNETSWRFDFICCIVLSFHQIEWLSFDSLCRWKWMFVFLIVFVCAQKRAFTASK